jgi:hypothetical protein
VSSPNAIGRPDRAHGGVVEVQKRVFPVTPQQAIHRITGEDTRPDMATTCVITNQDSISEHREA